MKALLVDDHAMFRDGLSLLIAHHFQQVDLVHAESLGQAIALAAHHADLDVVLLDLALPDSRGLEAIRKMRDAAPGARIVVLSADDSPDTVRGAIEEGAAGFIPKTAQSSSLRTALGTVLAGGVYLPTAMLGAGAAAAPGSDTAVAAELDLSPRQMQVLRLLIQGATNKVIGRELSLAESTVKTHLASIFERLKVNNRTQAVIAAARLGLRLAPG